MHAPVDVLLVDDDEDDYILARDLISEIPTNEYRVRWVQNYQDAVHALITAPADVCQLDYRLGARTGIELIHEVRGLGCEVPIIFLTGQTELELDVEAMHAGADDFLIKGSFTTRELQRAIRYAIERAATGAAQRRLTEELRLMQVQAQRSSQAKSTFLASMSHESRTPLNAILGYSYMLIDQLRTGDTAQLEDDLGRIKSAELGFGICPKSEIRNRKSKISLSLSLFVLRIITNHAHDSLAMNDLAFVADLFN